MGFISRLFSRKGDTRGEAIGEEKEFVTDFLTEAAKSKVMPSEKETPEIASIWDDSNKNEGGKNQSAATSEAGSSDDEVMRRARRRSRNKTRILGFEPQDTSVNELFQANAGEPEVTAVASPNIMSMEATGWLVVVSGPGRGASFPLFSGMASIGRNSDQLISLDFGDTSISRRNHASIAYDSNDNIFYFGHGGKSNLARINDKPVLSTEVVKDGDEFLIGETTLRLIAICNPDFNWDDEPEAIDDGEDNVAIA